MNHNVAKFIEREQAKGDNMFLPIGSTVTLKNWPVPGRVIGHHDGAPIIQPEACTVSDEQITSYTDDQGLTRIPFFQR